MDAVDEEAIAARIRSYESPLYAYTGVSHSQLGTLRKSAVLVPIFIQDGVPHVLLTKRSRKLRSHAGEVAFPGGMKDADDVTEADTALREAEEEVGLLRSDVRVVGRLPPRVTRNKVVIFPVVGIIQTTFVPTPSEDEVEAVFSLPLERFLRDEGHEAGMFQLRFGETGVFHVFQDVVDGRTYRTWGLTANIIIEVAVALLQRKPNFVFDAQVDVTPENPFAAQHLYLKKYYNFQSRL